jgi:hypothetical protein
MSNRQPSAKGEQDFNKLDDEARHNLPAAGQAGLSKGGTRESPADDGHRPEATDYRPAPSMDRPVRDQSEAAGAITEADEELAEIERQG